jgi:5'-nucleotidase
VRILVTNDDGIDAPGLLALVAALDDAGYEVVAAAPLQDMSGCSAALGSVGGDPIQTERRTLPGLDHVAAYGVAGAPALAVMAARLGGFGEPPSLVASGVNPGHNTGRATLHSGTVGAALTAANLGVSAVAVSVGWDNAPRFAAAAHLAVAAVGWLESAPTRTVLNLNVPGVDPEEVKGVRWAELAPFGTVRAAVVSSEEGSLQMELRETGAALPPDSDTALVLAGYAAVTSIVGIRAGEWQPVAAEIERRAARPPAGRRVRPESA